MRFKNVLPVVETEMMAAWVRGRERAGKQNSRNASEDIYWDLTAGGTWGREWRVTGDSRASGVSTRVERAPFSGLDKTGEGVRESVCGVNG